MSKRTVFEARREGRRLVLRRRRVAVWRLTWLLLAIPVGTGVVVASWHLVGATAGPTTRAAYTVVVFALMVGSIRLIHGGRR